MKKIITIMLIITSIFLVGCGKNEKETKYNIVVTSFPCYDFTRAIIKDADDISVEMLLKPGSETHDFDPTPKDIYQLPKNVFCWQGLNQEQIKQ